MNKITTITEYQQLASRTCPDLGTEERNLRHMHLGVVTEVGETLDGIKKWLAYAKDLDIVNIGEELADTAWYKANENRLYPTTPWTQEEFETLVAEFDAQVSTKALTQTLIESFILSALPLKYGEVDEDDTLHDLVVIKKVVEFYGLDFYQVLTNNINKLKIRYPERFTNEAALNRDTSAERVELEKE